MQADGLALNATHNQAALVKEALATTKDVVCMLVMGNVHSFGSLLQHLEAVSAFFGPCAVRLPGCALVLLLLLLPGYPSTACQLGRARSSLQPCNPATNHMVLAGCCALLHQAQQVGHPQPGST